MKMKRSLTVTWEDPLAAHSAGRTLSGLAYMQEIIAGRIPVPPMILLSGAQMRGIFLVVEVLLPLSAITLGAFVWWRRR